MAKKIIDNTPIEHFEDEWGGIVESGKYAGKPWGKTRGEVERVIKEKVADIESHLGGKAGCIRIVTNSTNNGNVVAVFSDEATFREWNSMSEGERWAEEGVAKILSYDAIPSPEGDDAYTVMLSMEYVPSIIHPTSDVSISLKGTSSVTYATGGTEDMTEDLIIEVQTRTSSSGAWVTRGTLVLPANLETFTEFNLKRFLFSGLNYVRIRAVGEYATSVWRSFTLEIVSLSITPNTQFQIPFTGSENALSLNYLIGGAVEKTVQFSFGTGHGNSFVEDYSETRNIGTSTNTSTGMTFDFNGVNVLSTILSEGVHTVRARLYVSETVLTDWIESQYLVAAGSSKFVNVNNVNDSVDNWTEASFFDWSAYCGGERSMQVVFRLSDATGEETYARWAYVAEDRTAYHLTVNLGIEVEDETIVNFYTRLNIEDENGNAIASPLYIRIVNNANNKPTSGADLIIQASGRSNGEENPDTIVNAKDGSIVESTFTGFNFITDGWMDVNKDADSIDVNAEKIRALHIPANRQLDVSYNPFSDFTSGNSTGRSATFEIDFRTTNILNENEPILRIGVDDPDGRIRGFEMLPLEAYMLTQNKRAQDDQNVGWAEGVRTHLAVNVVYGLRGLNLIRIMLDGGIEREIIYDTNDRFTANDVHIVMGNTTSDLDVFSIRCYKKALSVAEVQQDYKASMSTLNEQVEFAEKNDILGDDDTISWSKCIGKYNIIGHTGHLPKYGDLNKGKTTDVSLVINIVGDSAHSGTIDHLEASGQGTTAMTYYDWNQQYKITDESVFVSDDGTVGEAGSGYAIQTGEYLAKKLVGKINFASSMQSHKLGLTWIYNDLFKHLVSKGQISRPGQMTLYPNSRIAVYEKPFLFFHRETENDPWTFKYLMTFGAGKGDKPTFGFDKNLTPNMLMLEGANNDRPLALFIVPWNDDISYDPDEEAWMYGGQKQLNFGFGKTQKIDGKEYPSSSDAIAAQQNFFNFAYLHNSGITYFDGNKSSLQASSTADKTKMYWVTGDDVLGNSTRYDLFRFDHLTNQWVDAGVEKLGTGQYETLNMRTQYEAFCSEISATALVWTEGQWDAINDIIVSMRRRHFKSKANEVCHIDDALYHSCFVKFYAGTDNRAKNTYYYTDPEDLKIRFEQDDLDTTIKTNNLGQQRKPYYVEEHDLNEKGEFYWQGETNGFYNLLEESYENEMTNMMYMMMVGMAELGDTPIGFHEQYFLSTQDYFPIVAYNEQARLVYENAAVAQAAGVYVNSSVMAITQSCGRQRWSEYQWLKDRIMYISSWCEYGEFRGNSEASGGLSWRGYSGTYHFTLTPAKWLYPRIGSDSGNYDARVGQKRVRVAAGVPFSYADITLTSDSWISIRGIDYYLDLGDMNVILSSGQGTFEFAGRRLQKITINQTGEAPNQFLASNVSISSATNIKEFVMRGVSTATGTIDLSQCKRLEKIDIRGTYSTGINIPEGSPLAILYLNDKLTNLTLRDLQSVQTLSVEGVSALSNLYIEKMGAASRTLAEQCFSGNAPLTELTLIDIRWTSVSRDLLMWISGLPESELEGSISMLSTARLSMNDILYLYERYGDIQSEQNSLYISYTKIVIDSIGITGQKYYNTLGEAQFGVIASGNNVVFTNGKPALEWKFVKEENGQEVEDADAYEFMNITDDVMGKAQVVRLNPSGDETRYKLKVTATLENNDTVSATWMVGMFKRSPKRGDFAFADGTFDDEPHMGKTNVGFVVRSNPSETAGVVTAYKVDVCSWRNPTIRSNDSVISGNSHAWGPYPSNDNNGLNTTFLNEVSSYSDGVALTSTAAMGGGDNDFATSEKSNTLVVTANKVINGWIARMWENTDLSDYEESATDGQMQLMTWAKQMALSRQLPRTNVELGDMMEALQVKMQLDGDAAPVRYRQLFFPAAYSAYMYEPLVGQGETLHESYRRKKWMQPSSGMLLLIAKMYHKSRNKVNNGTISMSWANEDNTVADAEYPLFSNLLKRLYDAGISSDLDMLSNGGWWSCSEGSATNAWTLNGGTATLTYNNSKSYSYECRAMAAFTFNL